MLKGCDCLDRGLQRLALQVPCASQAGRRARELALRAQTPLARFADRPAMLGIAESATPEAAATVAPFGLSGSARSLHPQSSRKPAPAPLIVIPEPRVARYPGSRKDPALAATISVVSGFRVSLRSPGMTEEKNCSPE